MSFQEKLSKVINETARDKAFEMLKRSQCKISGVSVGAAVVASNPNPDYVDFHPLVFAGCNIEIATSRVIHAELVALCKAISEGFTKIESVHVTSTHKEQQAALCGYCRQDLMYINPEAMIYVYNPDKTLKIEVKLLDTMNYPYLGKGRVG